MSHFLFSSFTETFSLSTKTSSSFIDIMNTRVVSQNFTCEESLTARGSSKICLQTGRNQKLKICHCCVFVSYASRVDYSFTGTAGTMSAKTVRWCYPWAWAVRSWTATWGPGTDPEDRGDIDTYWHQESPEPTSGEFLCCVPTESYSQRSLKNCVNREQHDCD